MSVEVSGGPARPRILFATYCSSILRARWGGAKRQFQILLALSELGDVTCILPEENRFEQIPLPAEGAALEARVEWVRFAETPASGGSKFASLLAHGWGMLSHAFFSDLPFELAASIDVAVHEKAWEVSRGPFDLVVVSGVATAHQWQLLDRHPSIVNLEDVEHRRREALCRKLPWSFIEALQWVLYRLTLPQWKRAELDLLRHFDRALVCSAEEAVVFLSSSAVVIPNGASFPSALPPPEVPAQLNVLFFGLLSYLPNTQGLAWFIERCWPLLRSRYPDATLRVAGDWAASELALLDPGSGVEVIGFVEDLDAEIRRSTAVIAPVFWGGGTRLKIIEAVAQGTPVVTTRLGAEGLEFEDGVDLLFAEEPEDFAQAIARLHEDPELRRRLRESAFEKGNLLYKWSEIRKKIQLLADSLMK